MTDWLEHLLDREEESEEIPEGLLTSIQPIRRRGRPSSPWKKQGNQGPLQKEREEHSSRRDRREGDDPPSRYRQSGTEGKVGNSPEKEALFSPEGRELIRQEGVFSNPKSREGKGMTWDTFWNRLLSWKAPGSFPALSRRGTESGAETPQRERKTIPQTEETVRTRSEKESPLDGLVRQEGVFPRETIDPMEALGETVRGEGGMYAAPMSAMGESKVRSFPRQFYERMVRTRQEADYRRPQKELFFPSPEGRENRSEGAVWEAAALDRIFQRDARRYDGGFSWQ